MSSRSRSDPQTITQSPALNSGAFAALNSATSTGQANIITRLPKLLRRFAFVLTAFLTILDLKTGQPATEEQTFDHSLSRH